MASRRTLVLSASTLMVVAVGAIIYAIARQGDGNQELAQAPLNIETQVPPAFIMAVDNSGSMNFQTLLPAADGAVAWGRDSTSGAGNVWSYFHSSGSNVGQVREVADDNDNRNVYVAPFPAPRQNVSADREAAIPPFDSFGFARSPAYNRSYFDPSLTYKTWRYQDGTPWPDAVRTAVRVHPNVASPTVDMTAVLNGTTTAAGNDTRFVLRPGMVVPAGTRYRGTGCGLAGSANAYTTQATAFTISANSGICHVQIEYFPATFYLPSSAPAPAGYVVANRTLVQNACTYPGATTRCDLYKYEIKPANYSGSPVGSTKNYYELAIDNFSNWFMYYGNRTRAMVAGMSNSMVDISKMRVGYFTINGTLGNVAMRDMTAPAERTLLYTDMLSLTASGRTPNLGAVNHIGTQFQRTDASAPIKYSCQKNAGMLFTDGFSNESSSAPAVVGLGAPFDSTPANSMAAIASKYYFDAAGGVSPLRTDAGVIAGKVPIPDACATLPVNSIERKRLDCQSNLHMNFYGIALGGRGDIFNPDVKQDPFTMSPAPVWPGFESGARSTIDDIWHATVNTRGQFISARTPSDITEAMRRILEAVGSGTTPSGSVALTGSRIGTGSLSVVPFYASTNNGTDWYSTLTAQSISSHPVTGAVSYATSWEANERLPAYGSRDIWVAKTGGSVVPALSEFNASNVSLAELCANTLARCSASTIAALGVGLAETMDYLRGSQALEGNGTLRRRTKVLGDIVNSTPVVSSPIDDYGYQSLRGADTAQGLPTYNPYSYHTFLATKRTRAPMVYAGANDGMLHAFNGTTGVEEFAYIPSTSLGHMGNLLTPYSATANADQKFQHRYYVDGPVSVSDARLGSGGWKTVLVGTAGAGGRGAFALDVSTPGSFGANSVLWEINDSVTDTTIKNNIGHVLGKPVIVPVKVGATVAWKAIFGNGYGSINGRAALFVVDLDTGSARVVLATETDNTLPSKNGLGNIVVLDRYIGSTTAKSSDGFADTVYAGDQNGAVWKFDLRATTPAAQTVPFFIAKDAGGNRQSITGGFAAASGPSGGLMLYFGTGSFSFTGDANDTAMQSLYGVLDAETSGYSVTGRAQLQQQKITADSNNYRAVTAATPAIGSKGWYLDLGVSTGNAAPTAAGERAVGNPVVEGGVVFFPSYQPTNSTGCSSTGVNRIYGLNALSGGAALSQVRMGSLDATPTSSGTGGMGLETGGSAPVRDVGIMTTPRPSPLSCVPGSSGCISEADAANLTGARCSMVVQVAGAPLMYLPRPCGRQSWRQVR